MADVLEDEVQVNGDCDDVKEEETKVCSRCKKSKPVSDFISKRDKNSCKTCSKCRDVSARSHQKNRDKSIEASKKWKENNREYVKEYRKNQYYNTLDTFEAKGQSHGKPSKHRKDHIIQNGVEMKTCSACKNYKPLDNFSASSKTWDKLRHQCKDCIRKQIVANKEQIAARRKEYYEKNKAKLKEKVREFRNANREHIRAQRRKYKKKQRETNPQYRLKENMRGRVYRAVREQNVAKSRNTFDLVDCTVGELREHLERQFQDGMTWDNYGEWHVDHIKPCCKFDLTQESEQLKCFHYSNLQPMWGSENIAKGGKYESDNEESSSESEDEVDFLSLLEECEDCEDCENELEFSESEEIDE